MTRSGGNFWHAMERVFIHCTRNYYPTYAGEVLEAYKKLELQWGGSRANAFQTAAPPIPPGTSDAKILRAHRPSRFGRIQQPFERAVTYCAAVLFCFSGATKGQRSEPK